MRKVVERGSKKGSLVERLLDCGPMRPALRVTKGGRVMGDKGPPPVEGYAASGDLRARRAVR